MVHSEREKLTMIARIGASCQSDTFFFFKGNVTLRLDLVENMGFALFARGENYIFLWKSS